MGVTASESKEALVNKKKHQVTFSSPAWWDTLSKQQAEHVLLLSKWVEEIKSSVTSNTVGGVLHEQEFQFFSSLAGAGVGCGHHWGEAPPLDTRTGV